MAALKIDRMSLKLPGMSARHGQQLAQDVAGCLAAAPLSSDGGSEVAALDLRVRRAAGESGDALARRIAAEIIRQLDRTA
jgi:hypothetical protein